MTISQHPPSKVVRGDAGLITNPEELEAAFLHFVDATRELEALQQKLSQEIYRLTEDLAKSNADLTLQIEAKGRLAEELAALLSALPTGVIILREGKVYAFNDMSATLAPELAMGMEWQLPKQWTAIDEAHYRVSDRHDARIIRPEVRKLVDGRELMLLHDVTATFRAREQAEHQAKLSAMGRMAAEIAHQLRTPLATATVYAGHLGKPQLAPEQRTRFADQLGKQLAWLDGLVSRMMSFLRNKHGPSALVCVAELLDECRLTIEPLYESKGVVLKLEVQGGEHLLSVQRDQIRGGLVSLLENALQVSNEGQSVRVVAKAAHARLSITIDDDGPGIAPDMMQRLFEPFATGSARGTGLGLAIAKAAVEAHRGQIQAENRKEGGARFHIVLPVLEQL